jgi:hypothetical protein
VGLPYLSEDIPTTCSKSGLTSEFILFQKVGHNGERRQQIRSCCDVVLTSYTCYCLDGKSRLRTRLLGEPDLDEACPIMLEAEKVFLRRRAGQTAA